MDGLSAAGGVMGSVGGDGSVGDWMVLMGLILVITGAWVEADSERSLAKDGLSGLIMKDEDVTGKVMRRSGV